MTTEWRALPVSGRLFESARWLADEACFQWVDILEANLYRWWPETDALASHHFDFDFLPLATPSAGDQLIADRDTVYRYVWGGDPRPLVTLPVGEAGRLNDGIVHPDGSLWIGSMGFDQETHPGYGKLWRITPAAEVTQMADGIGISNGIVWIDESKGYYVDSAAGTIDYITFERGTLARQTKIVVAPPGEPDGVCVHKNQLWSAIWGAGELQMVDLDSRRITAHIPVPSARPSSVAFSDLCVLVTAAGSGDGSRLSRSGSVLVSDAAGLAR